MTQPILPHFDGTTYEPAQDNARLSGQLRKVFLAMKDGGWWTLRDLARMARASEASVSARLRDLRKPRFGGWEVERRRVCAGLYEYRLVIDQ